MSFWDDPWESISDTVQHVSDVVTDVGDDIGLDWFDSDGLADSRRESESVVDDLTGKTQADAEEEAARLAKIAALKGEELQKYRFNQTEERLSPWMSNEKEALAAYRGELGLGPKVGTGSPYMDTPGYQSMMDESLRSSEQSAVSSGSSLYGGRRIKAAGEVGAGVQQSFYNNYMNMLGQAASPDTTTNVSSLGLGQAATMRAAGTRDAATQGQYLVNQADIKATGTQDTAGMLLKIFGGI